MAKRDHLDSAIYPNNNLKGIANDAFEGDGPDEIPSWKKATPPSLVEKKLSSEESSQEKIIEEPESDGQKRDTWGKPIEFLLSCIAMSVGLGNVWRFPFTAYENGGGAFLIPYIIVLVFIGKPLYFLEMVLGQFSSYGSVKVWDAVPFVKGVGYGQAMATWFVVTYYCCLMALTVFYFFSSFQSVLPWTVCDPAWADEHCVSAVRLNATNMTIDDSIIHFPNPVAANATAKTVSSVEQYFMNNVLQKLPDIDHGIGLPEWRLTLCLMFAWICIFLILMKGVASSGKAAYFTAIFPYVVLITLLIRGVTLEGAYEGIKFFITPQWEKLADAKVWYAAVTQCFFSLSVGFGPIITFSSYNPFHHRIYRDANIVSFMDTFTSLLAGFTIFSILGNLAHESGKSIEEVVKGGTGLAFVSYAEAIAKFDFVPQLFAVLFFLMLFTLGIGSAVSLTGCVITVICDAFPKLKKWVVTLIVCVAGALIGLVYVTPGGQYILDLVDYFGGGFIIFVMATIETIAIAWIYGLKRLLRDIHFMLGIRLGIYWKFTWGFFIPVALVGIFVYSLITMKPLQDGDYIFPASAMASGWMLTAVALIQVPAWGLYVAYKQHDLKIWRQGLKEGFQSTMALLTQALKKSFQPTDEWGPKDPKVRSSWILFNPENEEHSWIPKWIKKLCRVESHPIQSSVQEAMKEHQISIITGPR